MAKKIITDDGEIIDAPIASTKPLFFKTPWNHDTDQVALDTGTWNNEPTKTQQHLADEQEMATILRKFFQTGTVEQTSTPLGYAEVQDETDLLDTIVTADQVQEAWDKLPLKARNILRNPHTFAAYMSQIDENSLDDLVDMGLATKKAPPAPPEPPKPPTPAVGTPATAPAAQATAGPPVT